MDRTSLFGLVVVLVFVGIAIFSAIAYGEYTCAQIHDEWEDEDEGSYQ